MYAASRLRQRCAWQWQPTLIFHEHPFPMPVEHAARKLVYPSRYWSGFDNTNVNAGKAPSSRFLSTIGDKANHLSGLGRMLFCASIVDADSPTVTTDPIFRLLFPETNRHGTERVWVALCLPRALASTPNYFGRGTVGPFQRGGGQTTDAVSSPAYLAAVTMTEPVIVGGRLREIEVMVANGFRLVGLTIYERSRSDGALNGSLDVFDAGTVTAGAPIRDGPLRKIRRSLESSWRTQRNVACGSVVGNATTCRITGTTETNIFDRTSTSRTGSTPGVLIDEYLGGYAHTASVQANIAVNASITGGATGLVRFHSSVGSIAISGIGTERKWYRTTIPLLLSTVETRGAGAASEKVDILAAAGTAGQSIDVVAWSIATVPA